MAVFYSLDKERELKLKTRNIDRIETKLDKAFLDIDLEHLRMREIATIVWGCINDPEITIDNVMDLIDAHSNIVEAINKIAECIIASTPDGDGKNVKRASAKGTGSKK